MHVNPLVFPTALLALVLLALGQYAMRKMRTRRQQIGFGLFGGLVSIPGWVMAGYYTHWLGEPIWYYRLRTIAYTELSAAGLGLLAGCFLPFLQGKLLFLRSILIAGALFGVLVPYLKPVIVPVRSDEFIDLWQDDVCMQSTSSSCGAASAATICRLFRVPATEEELARECYTYSGGTENWYLTRALRKRGLFVRYRVETEFPKDLQLPAIAGVEYEQSGHFITILNKQAELYCIGDPLIGRQEIHLDELHKQYRFTGFFMEISKIASSETTPD